MGADLIVSAVEIERGKEPLWGAAEEHLKGMIPRDVVGCVLLIEQGEIIEDDISLEDVEYEYDVTEDGARKRLELALTECREGWLGERRGIVSMSLVANAVLIAADRSFGDPVEDVDSLSLFVDSGMAKAAGFITD